MAQPHDHPAPRGATSVEVYGFVGWMTTAVAYVLFLIWAYTPEEYLQAIGVTYYPSRYWALALPAWVCVAVVCAYWGYESMNMLSTPAFESLETIQDSATRRPESVNATHGVLRDGDKRIPPLADLPIAQVSQLLYRTPRRPPGARPGPQ